MRDLSLRKTPKEPRNPSPNRIIFAKTVDFSSLEYMAACVFAVQSRAELSTDT